MLSSIRDFVGHLYFILGEMSVQILCFFLVVLWLSYEFFIYSERRPYQMYDLKRFSPILYVVFHFLESVL